MTEMASPTAGSDQGTSAACGQTNRRCNELQHSNSTRTYFILLRAHTIPLLNRSRVQSRCGDKLIGI